MIVTAPSMVQAANGLSLDHPIILWNSVVNSFDLASTTEDELYPVSNLANPASHLIWRGSGDASPAAIEYITLDTDAQLPIDSVGIAKHNFGSNGNAISIEADDGGGFDVLIAPFTPDDDSPLLIRFNPVYVQSIRVKIAVGAEEPEAAVLYIGSALILPRKIYQGHTPINFGRRRKTVVGKSESGNYLGSIITTEWRETRQSLTLIEPAYYREHIDPFIEACGDTPFFFGWRPESYPGDLGYAWMTNEPMPRNATGHGLIEIELQMSGIV